MPALLNHRHNVTDTHGHALRYNVTQASKSCLATRSVGLCTLISIPTSVHGNRQEATNSLCSAINGELRESGMVQTRTWSQLYQDAVVASIFSTALTPQHKTYVDLAANAAVSYYG